MEDKNINSLKHPLLDGVPVRTSFKDTSKMVQGDVLAQNIFLSLDKAIRFERGIIDTEEARKYLKIFRKIQWIKTLTLYVYFFFMFFEVPTWCVNRNEIPNSTCDNHIYPNSGIPKMPHYVSCILELSCVLILLGFVIFKRKFRNPTKNKKRREVVHIVLTIISVIDIIISLITHRGLVVSKFIRVIRIMLSIRQLRRALNRIGLVIYDSSQILLFLLAYIIVFGYIGFRLFRGTQEGAQYFPDKLTSTWNLLVFITTANSPDIVLPALKMGMAYVIFFVMFIVFGLFFLMNLLLAVFYSNYKNRVEDSLINFEEERSSYLEKKFNEFGGEKGYLSPDECTDLLGNLLTKFKDFDESNIDVQKFVSLLDRDTDHKITLQEFYSYFDVIGMLQIQEEKAYSNIQTESK